MTTENRIPLQRQQGQSRQEQPEFHNTTSSKLTKAHYGKCENESNNKV